MSELLFNRINGLIAKATFAKDTDRMLTLRAIKAELLNVKIAEGKIPDEIREAQIIKSMIKQREKDAKIYEENKRFDLAIKEKVEINILSEFLPKEVTVDEIEFAISVSGIDPFKANMGKIIQFVKQKYPTADGKLVADVVKSHLV